MTNVLWQDRVNDEVWEQPKEEKMDKIEEVKKENKDVDVS